jgi:hypothetical protein
LKILSSWTIALIGSLIAGLIVNYAVISIVDNIFMDKYYVTISASAILFPIATFLCGLRMSPGYAGKRSGFILLVFVFTIGMLYISTSISPRFKVYILYYYIFYIIGCLIDLVIVLKLKPNETGDTINNIIIK